MNILWTGGQVVNSAGVANQSETKSHISYCVTTKSHITKHKTLILNLHYMKHAFFCMALCKAFVLYIISDKHVARSVCQQFVYQLQHVCFTFCIALSAITSTCAGTCTYT